MADIQWFPGHMAKTRRQMEKVLPMVDAVLELCDARIPAASRNPMLGEIIGNKPLVLLLNKCDVADPAVTKRWISEFERGGGLAVAADCKTGTNVQRAVDACCELLADKLRAFAQKGMTGRTPRILVAGVPNVGKSSLINRLSGSARAKTEDRPGVTRQNQWYSVHKKAELLDTPGILWPKFGDPHVGFLLAVTGAVKDTLFDTEELAARLLTQLSTETPDLLAARYGSELQAVSGDLRVTDGKLPDWQIDESSVFSAGLELLSAVARTRGMLKSGGLPDTERAAIMVLDEFRAGKIGRISLENPTAIP
ncbi:MAG: ribosome biogenesis GTPase YlqF [Oscillospiraceae bacterium]|jgi:ribosome biogenesis GTPase A|nr:ribosome biogenesis GTPase YlqF [Oscillospiraceae bacterium]